MRKPSKDAFVEVVALWAFFEAMEGPTISVIMHGPLPPLEIPSQRARFLGELCLQQLLTSIFLSSPLHIYPPSSHHPILVPSFSITSLFPAPWLP